VNGSGGAIHSYLWGQDLSGTMSEAGGIGGLLMVADHVPATDTYHFVAYDGNGNVTALINAADQSISARYEYSPFGEMLRASGPMSVPNPFRWSTKFWDSESGLGYYGKRYYSPALGRWISKDPIEQDGGLNIYAFLANAALNDRDAIGAAPSGHHPGLTEIYQRMEALGGGPGSEIIKLWTVDFNANHLRNHPQYNAAVWEHVEDLMRLKGFTDLNKFFSAMNNDVNLTLEFAGRILESPGTGAYNSLVAKAGISAASEALGRSVARVAKIGVKAIPVLAVLGVASQAGDFEHQIIDYGRSKVNEDWGMNLLDAAVVTGTFRNMTGNYYVGMALLDSLLQ